MGWGGMGGVKDGKEKPACNHNRVRELKYTDTRTCTHTHTHTHMCVCVYVCVCVCVCVSAQI